MGDLLIGRYYTLLFLCSLFIFFKQMVMATFISTDQCSIAFARTLIVAGDRRYFIGRPISYRWLFCPGKFKEDAYPGAKELEPTAYLSVVCPFYSIFK